MPEIESGLKWWMRYVIVPMIGGGGIIAIVVAVIATYDKPKPPQPDRDDSNRFSLAMSAQQNTKESAPEKKSSALMFEARNDSIEGKGPWVKDRIDVVSGNYVGFQWNVPNPKGRFACRALTPTKPRNLSVLGSEQMEQRHGRSIRAVIL